MLDKPFINKSSKILLNLFWYNSPEIVVSPQSVATTLTKFTFSREEQNARMGLLPITN